MKKVEGSESLFFFFFFIFNAFQTDTGGRKVRVTTMERAKNIIFFTLHPPLVFSGLKDAKKSDHSFVGYILPRTHNSKQGTSFNVSANYGRKQSLELQRENWTIKRLFFVPASSWSLGTLENLNCCNPNLTIQFIKANFGMI